MGPRQKKLEVTGGTDTFGYAKREKDAMNSGRGPLSIAGHNPDSLAMNGMAMNRQKYLSSNGTGLTPANRSGLGVASRQSGTHHSASRPEVLASEPPKQSFFGMGAGNRASQPNKPPLFNNRQL